MHISNNSGEDTVLMYSGHLTTQGKRYATTVVRGRDVSHAVGTEGCAGMHR
jgi:hypothetical protein